MCGRFALFTDPSDLAEQFGLVEPSFEPTYNAAPSETLPVVLDDEPETLSTARWGLVPSWSDGPGSGPEPINARVESLTESRAFREAYRARRCVVPADGFYEWTETGTGKQPVFVSRADARPFLLAGLWETWTADQTQTGLGEFESGGPSREPETVRSFTVVTTEPDDVVGQYHDRMALVLTSDAGDEWLAGEDVDALLDAGAVELEAHPVSTDVNDPTVDHPGLVESVS